MPGKCVARASAMRGGEREEQATFAKRPGRASRKHADLRREYDEVDRSGCQRHLPPLPRLTPFVIRMVSERKHRGKGRGRHARVAPGRSGRPGRGYPPGPEPKTPAPFTTTTPP